MENRDVIFRHCTPTVLDESSYGTVCIHKDSGQDSYDLYLQVSHKDGLPLWELQGKFTINTPQDYIDNIIKQRLE